MICSSVSLLATVHSLILRAWRATWSSIVVYYHGPMIFSSFLSVTLTSSWISLNVRRGNQIELENWNLDKTGMMLDRCCKISDFKRTRTSYNFQVSTEQSPFILIEVVVWSVIETCISQFYFFSFRIYTTHVDATHFRTLKCQTESRYNIDYIIHTMRY